ncbi:hypothetical protein, partial [Lysobacter sp. N42]|uniref:hypothetical protein n=1 Tax=Lysobacter sp. N42 TaxID=2545719 RepID=UPI001A9EB97D
VDGAAQPEAAATQPAGADGKRAPRAETRAPRTQPTSPRAKAELEATQAAPARPGLLHRVARGLKSLITRAPRSQH